MNSQLTYHLIAQLIEIKKKRLWDNSAEFDNSELLSLLENNSGVNFNDEVQSWVDWFLRQDTFSEKDKKSLKLILKIFEIEKKSKEKLIRKGK